MARYIKANPKVAVYLGLENDRNKVTDGNYLLWQGDMLAFGPLTQLPETLAQIGGLALLPHEAREEQDGTVTRPLPVATDPRFVIEAESADADTDTDESDATGDGNGGAEQEPTQEGESATENQESAATNENEGGDSNEQDND